FILIAIGLLAVFAPIFSKYSFKETNYDIIYQTPSMTHLFGTDQFGRDLWVRTWMGTRISLLIAFVAAVLDLTVGVAYGAVSALSGGKVDAVMQRIVEVLVGIPHLIIVILLMMVMPAGIWTIVVALSITGWVNMARLVRAEILKLKNQEFVMAAQVLGTRTPQIILKHLVPNTVGVIVINAMFTIPSAIFTEAFLSFIGIGMQEPAASLGVLINNGYQVLRNFPHVLIYPAIVIVLIMVCFSILGDGLRDALDPRMRK
ncbi:MAG: ABC transporter permease, partial [Clostridium sp.]|nr:ABC transporter permease [Clostridium sp.]